jgi:tetratricopeptide (TPR) repeat protein
VTTGRGHLTGRRHAEAIVEFQAALRLVPNDPTATKLLRDAEAARDAAANDAKKADAEARLKAKVKLDFDRNMADGNRAMQLRRYADAVREYGEALKLLPNDAAARSALQRARDALEGEQKAKDDEEKKKKAKDKQKADFDRLMDAGRQFAAAKRYDDAVKAYREALTVQPNDPAAVQALRAVEAVRDGDLAKEVEAKKRQDQYAAHMTAGRAALTARRYDDAVREFQAAQQLFPGDRNSAGLLQQALRARDDAKVEPKKVEPKVEPKKVEPKVEPKKVEPKTDDKRQQDYLRLMQQAEGLYKQGRYDDAVRVYGQALQLMPNDKAATDGRRNALYADHIVTGRSLLKQKQFKRAQTEFEAALKLFPTSKEAKDGIEEAKKGK